MPLEAAAPLEEAAPLEAATPLEAAPPLTNAEAPSVEMPVAHSAAKATAPVLGARADDGCARVPWAIASPASSASSASSASPEWLVYVSVDDFLSSALSSALPGAASVSPDATLPDANLPDATPTSTASLSSPLQPYVPNLGTLPWKVAPLQTHESVQASSPETAAALSPASENSLTNVDDGEPAREEGSWEPDENVITALRKLLEKKRLDATGTFAQLEERLMDALHVEERLMDAVHAEPQHSSDTSVEDVSSTKDEAAATRKDEQGPSTNDEDDTASTMVEKGVAEDSKKDEEGRHMEERRDGPAASAQRHRGFERASSPRCR